MRVKRLSGIGLGLEGSPATRLRQPRAVLFQGLFHGFAALGIASGICEEVVSEDMPEPQKYAESWHLGLYLGVLGYYFTCFWDSGNQTGVLSSWTPLSFLMPFRQ